MSCEVFRQAICEHGHLYEDDGPDRLPKQCPHCDASWAWDAEWNVTNEGPPPDEMAVIVVPAIAHPPVRDRGTDRMWHETGDPLPERLTVRQVVARFQAKLEALGARGWTAQHRWNASHDAIVLVAPDGFVYDDELFGKALPGLAVHVAGALLEWDRHTRKETME